jgi:hypothetical protein
MERHSTPFDVASVLLRRIPENIRRILEPSVGTGDLLAPITEQLRRRSKEVVCVDSDGTALRTLRNTLGKQLGKSLITIKSDFLKWANHPSKLHEPFDCIVMNPPFLGRPADFEPISPVAFPVAAVKHNVTRRAPTELAFVAKALALLKRNGRLLAILPASLISSERTLWFRQRLLEQGAFLYVHELPRNTFKHVEARIYLCVYKKGAHQRQTLLCNHRLQRPDAVRVTAKELSVHTRFDFSFHEARRSYESTVAKTPKLAWHSIASIAFIQRGDERSPIRRKATIHTSNFSDGFWSSRLLFKGNASAMGLLRSDIVIKRVGRHCALSAGLYQGVNGRPFSDCLFRIHSWDAGTTIALLLGIRVAFGSHCGRHLLEQGTAAAYITEDSLGRFRIPLDLALRYPIHFGRYERALRIRSLESMLSVEHALRNSVFGPESGSQGD